LLAQTRQADRDKMQSLADAEHREALHREGEDRSALVATQTAMLLEMLQQNTDLTEKIRTLAERVEVLTREVHKNVCSDRAGG
jgi:hypothetical protein